MRGEKYAHETFSTAEIWVLEGTPIEEVRKIVERQERLLRESMQVVDEMPKRMRAAERAKHG